jgi:hypothetical protein
MPSSRWPICDEVSYHARANVGYLEELPRLENGEGDHVRHATTIGPRCARMTESILQGAVWRVEGSRRPLPLPTRRCLREHLRAKGGDKRLAAARFTSLRLNDEPTLANIPLLHTPKNGTQTDRESAKNLGVCIAGRTCVVLQTSTVLKCGMAIVPYPLLPEVVGRGVPALVGKAGLPKCLNDLAF